MSRQIVIRASNWIGDCVMSVPAIKELRRLYPDARLTVLGYRGVADLFREQSFVDQVLSLQPAGFWSRLREERRLLQGCDRIILFPNSFSSAFSAFLCRVPQRLGYRSDGRSFFLSRAVRPRSQRLGVHQAYYYLDLLHQLGLSEIDYLALQNYTPDLTLRAPESAVGQANVLLEEAGVDRDRPRVVLHPGAAFGSAKRWFLDRYATLADRLVAEEDVEILLVGSKGEIPLGRAIQKQMRCRAHCLSGQTSLSTLMGLLSQCSLVLTNDSGPMHLAAALGVPQVALFGSTDEIATGPLSDRAVVIHKHVECSPCLLRECPIDLRCFDRISVDEVFQAARGVLAGR